MNLFAFFKVNDFGCFDYIYLINYGYLKVNNILSNCFVLKYQITDNMSYKAECARNYF